jgi:hypothetical protein
MKPIVPHTRPSRQQPLLQAIVLAGLCELAGTAQTIPNPSFEADTFTGWPGYIATAGNHAITGWTASNDAKVGLNPAGGSPFADNGAIPDGKNVAFIQSQDEATTLSTTITGLTVGTTYKVTFRENARNGQAPNLRVQIDATEVLGMTVYSTGGANAYWYVGFEFTASATSQVMALINDAAGDHTVCVDDFKIVASDGRWQVAPWTGDADSGVDSQYLYTHAYNFASSASPVIQGVTFTGVAGGNPNVTGKFFTTWLGNVFNLDSNTLTGAGDGSATLATDFCYGGTISAGNYQSITALGLTPGTEYVFTFFTVGFDAPSLAIRWATFSVGNDPLTVNQDQFGNDYGLTISYRYTADASGSVTFKYVPICPNNVSIHTYGFCNREAMSRNVKPFFVAQPRSITVAPGLAVTFGAGANGLPAPTYQWRYQGSNIPGATESTYTLPSVAASDAGNYDVVAANALGSATSVVARLTVGLAMDNPSFEADLFTVWPGYVNFAGYVNGPISGWNAMGGHGLNPANGSPFADNGLTPHGNQVAFLQADGALSQVVSGLTVGEQYYVHYHENSRNCCSGTTPFLEVSVGGAVVVPAHPVPPVLDGNPYHEVSSYTFVATATALELVFTKSNPQLGDTTALIDNVTVVPIPPGTPAFVGLDPKPVLASVGDAATFLAIGAGTSPVTYQWLKNGADIAGATNTTLVFGNVQKPDEADYSYRVSNAAGNATSAAAHLTVYEPVPDLFNTGVDNHRVALADNATDPHYRLLTNPDTGSTNAIVEDSTVFPIASGPWLLNTTASKWIGPRLNTSPSAVGLYTYRTVIDLTDRDPSTLIIEGRWATDNTGRGILVNEVSTDNPQNTAQFGSWTPFHIYGTNVNLVAGPNTIDFVVENEAAIGYTGLRVEIVRSNLRIPPGTPPEILTHPASKNAAEGDTVTFTAAARGTAPLSYQWNKDGVPLPGKTSLTLTLSAVTAADSGLYTFTASNPLGSATSSAALLSVWLHALPLGLWTGVDNSGALLPAGSVDPHFILATSADPDYPGPNAIVINDGWPADGTWLLQGPTSKWIAPQADQATGSYEGDYTYQATLDLTGQDLKTLVLSGGWAVDNSASDILVNGVSSGLTCAGFGAYTPLLIRSNLVAGVNTFDFLVNNAPATPNPTGLRVDVRAYTLLPAKLTAKTQAGTVTVYWLPAYDGQRLQSAPAVTGPWTDVANQTNPYQTSASGRQFFKVVYP